MDSEKKLEAIIRLAEAMALSIAEEIKSNPAMHGMNIGPTDFSAMLAIFVDSMASALKMDNDIAAGILINALQFLASKYEHNGEPNPLVVRELTSDEYTALQEMEGKPDKSKMH